MHLALFQPDIPQNTGALIRLSACMSVPIHIIEPCGFAFDDKKMRRAVMDYYDLAHIIRHTSWDRFIDWRQGAGGRLLLLSTHAATVYTEFAFAASDILLLGSESSGAPEAVHKRADARLRIPVQRGARSLNVAQAAAVVLAEALRQTDAWPVS